MFVLGSRVIYRDFVAGVSTWRTWSAHAFRGNLKRDYYLITRTQRREENHFTPCRATTHTAWQIADRVYRNKIFMSRRKTMDNFSTVLSSPQHPMLYIRLCAVLSLRDYSLVRKRVITNLSRVRHLRIILYKSRAPLQYTRISEQLIRALANLTKRASQLFFATKLSRFFSVLFLRSSANCSFFTRLDSISRLAWWNFVVATNSRNMIYLLYSEITKFFVQEIITVS